mmetsp:Transcript_20443/g.54778  ORF Transcript_20443/g.54778 Transcript_20443/m.54778 type:complete len:374 (-) Transcript_20443:112-1233(-)
MQEALLAPSVGPVDAPKAPSDISGRGSAISSKLAGLSARCKVPGEEPSHVAFVIRSSLAVNLCLFLAKLFAFVTTGSLAVLASLVDSIVDLSAQTILMIAQYLAERRERNGYQEGTIYPVGVARVEPLGVITCAVIMVLASAAVMQQSGQDLWNNWNKPGEPHMTFTWVSGVLLFSVIILKVLLWMWCWHVGQRERNVSLEAIKTDNWNDIVSNSAALISAVVTRCSAKLWLSDPIGAIVISLYIICAWLVTVKEQIEMVVGKTASSEFLAEVREIADTFDPTVNCDIVRAYHFGPKFLIEIELVMDRNTILQTSHDVGMLLQDRVEHMEDCERCFVHIDYDYRQHDDHDKTVPINLKISLDQVAGSCGCVDA